MWEKGLNLQGEVCFAEAMSSHTSLRVGGPADIWIMPHNVDNLCSALRTLHEQKVPITVIGRGTNLLVAEAGVRGAVISLSKLDKVDFAGEQVRAQAGVSLAKLAKMTAKRGLSGLESLAGIPGTVGGAVAMNAGAYGSNMASIVEQVHMVNFNGHEQHADRAEMEFGYRTSVLNKCPNLAVVEVLLNLRADTSNAVKERMIEFARKRARTQPLGQPSCGSVFKNPPGDYAARLIQECGLKGVSKGGATISPRHANFIVTGPGARAQDVMDLIEMARQTVAQRFGVWLELEVQLLGWDSWAQVKEV